MAGGDVVEVYEGDLDRPYEVVGRVRARTDVFHLEPGLPPDRGQLDVRLGEKAFDKYGANAVIQVHYNEIWIEDANRPLLIGEGVAVIFDCQCEHSSGVFWGDRCLDCAGRRTP